MLYRYTCLEQCSPAPCVPSKPSSIFGISVTGGSCVGRTVGHYQTHVAQIGMCHDIVCRVLTITMWPLSRHPRTIIFIITLAGPKLLGEDRRQHDLATPRLRPLSAPDTPNPPSVQDCTSCSNTATLSGCDSSPSTHRLPRLCPPSETRLDTKCS